MMNFKISQMKLNEFNRSKSCFLFNYMRKGLFILFACQSDMLLLNSMRSFDSFGEKHLTLAKIDMAIIALTL